MKKLLAACVFSMSLMASSAWAHDEYDNLPDATDEAADSIIDQLADHHIMGMRLLVVEGKDLNENAPVYSRHQAQTGRVLAESLASELTRQGVIVQQGMAQDALPGDIVVMANYSRGALQTLVNVKAVRMSDGSVVASQQFLVRSTLY